MARVRLTLDQPNSHHTFRFIRPDGTRDAIPALRLSVIVDLSASVVPGLSASWAAFPDCVFDTGSHLSTVPERLHRQLKPGVVTPLPFDPAMPQNLRVITVGGGTFPYELGMMSIRLRDRQGGVLDVSMIAQFVRDGGVLNLPLLLGLRGGVIDGRTFKAEPNPASPHGQEWFLED